MARLARFAEQSDGPVGGLSTQAVGGVRATVALGVVMMCCLVAGPALAKGHGRPLQVRLVETTWEGLS